MVKQSEQAIESDKDLKGDEIVIIELRKIADSVIPMLSTEADYPTKHPELENKFPILDMAVWVEVESLTAPGMECARSLHTQCSSGVCLPIGDPKSAKNYAIEGDDIPATSLVQQIQYQFYSKPMAPKKTNLASSAQPWSQKITTFTQEVIRRLLRTKKELSCAMKQNILR